MSEEPPSLDIEVGPSWQDTALDLETDARAVLAAVLARLEMAAPGVEVGIRFSEDDAVQALNATWRGRDAPTDVLSFPATEPGATPLPGVPLLLGDVVLARGVCTRDAERLGRPLRDHVRHLLVHGLLHLFHYDHETHEAAAVMEPLEVRILDDLGVADPYAAHPLDEETR